MVATTGRWSSGVPMVSYVIRLGGRRCRTGRTCAGCWSSSESLLELSESASPIGSWCTGAGVTGSDSLESGTGISKGSSSQGSSKLGASVACVWDPFDLPTEPHTRVGNPFV